MKLLIILKTAVPYELKSGGQQAVYHMIDYLRHKMDISLLFPYQGEAKQTKVEDLQSNWANVNFYIFKSSLNGNYLFKRIIIRIYNKITAIMHTKIYKDYNILDNELSGFDIPQGEYLDFINNVIEKNEIEIVQTEFFTSLNLVYSLPEHVKKVFINHEIRFVRLKQVLENSKEVTRRDVYKYNKIKSDELSAMQKYDAIVLLSDIDRKKVIEEGLLSEKVFSSPVGIPNTKVDFRYTHKSNVLSFLGGTRHPPNVNGITWFLENVWEKILEQEPEFELNVIGEWFLEYKNKLIKYRNVNFLGAVENLSEVLSGTIMIIPILIGSGVRMKAMEGINEGCPIVSTHVGIEGLNFTSGRDCFIEDDPDLFAKRILELNNNQELKETFVTNSREWYNNQYSIEKLGDKRFSIYEKIMKI